MESKLNIDSFAAEFVVAYYTACVYDFRSVIKFYDPEKALIYRQSLPDGKPAKVNEAKHFIVPILKGHEKLVVLNYTFNPLSINNDTENGTQYFNVVTIGKIVKDEKEGLFSQFSQFFTLEFVNNERVAIISDSLTIIPHINNSNNNNSNEEVTGTNELVSIPASEILFEIDHRPAFLNRQNQSKRQQQQQQQQLQQQQQPLQPSQQPQQPNGENKSFSQSSKNVNKRKNKNNNNSNRFVYTPD